MPAAWPPTLPHCFEAPGPEEAMGEARQAFANDKGPAKLIAQTRAPVRPISGTLIMTREQVAEMEAFVADDLAQATLPFTFPAPRGSNTLLVRIRAGEMPTISPIAPGRYRIGLALEVLP